MALAPSTVRRLVFLAYPASGLALGLADAWLGRLAQSLGTKPGVATVVTVNLLLPLAAVALGLAHGRVRGALLGTAAMTLGLIAGLAACYARGGPGWSPVGVLRAVPPVLVAAALGYAVLGTVAALVRRALARPGENGTAPPGYSPRTPPV